MSKSLLALIAAFALVLAACPAEEDPDDVPEAPAPPEAVEEEDDPEATQGDPGGEYEVWAMDQGTGVVHILDPDGAEIDRIDLSDDVTTPHMIDFDSQHRYAFIANTGSGDVAVIRAEDREVVDIVETGETAHMAHVTPDDTAVWVANIGAETLTEITLDLDNEEFAIGRELAIREDPLFVENEDNLPSAGPVCHDYTADSRYAYVTLGPAYTDAALLVVDLEEVAIERVYGNDEVPANCGTLRSSDGGKMYVNGGGAETGEEGTYWVFDTDTHDLLSEHSSGGIEAHGVALTADGSELWLVNRASSNAVVVDTDTDEIVREIDDTGTSPDILVISPDDRFVYITLRGPEPRSGPHAIAGDTPGVAVLDADTGEIVEIVQPAGENPDSDFHGIGLRPLLT